MNALSKIMVVGAYAQDPEIYTYALSFGKALKNLGYEISTFNYREKLFSGIFSQLNHHAINRALIKQVAATKPDLLFLVKAETITAKTLETIKQKLSCKIINFYPDNPFTFWNGNSNSNVLSSLPLYNCFLSWSHMLTQPLLSAGCNHTCFFPFAYDEEIFSSQDIIKNMSGIKKEIDVCFVGTWEPMREKWLDQLITMLPSTVLAIWGNDWQEKCQSDKLKKYIRGNALYNRTMILAFSASKIVLNFIRKQNLTSHNMRTFEVPASNSFLLTQRTHEQAELFFQEGVSIECFDNGNELAQKVTFYLNNDSARQAITQKGFIAAQNFALTQQLKNYFKNCTILNR